MHDELIERHKKMVAKRMAHELDVAIAKLPPTEGLSPFLSSQDSKGIPLNELTGARILSIAGHYPKPNKEK